ncbi:hypothetical protein H2200_012432 [Cladophialophora chaetospira]|uniref:Uncharacterized protein n=1 Tax=Cladophialophora chaetospira TaxID=386627 RepID=A0AA38WXX7_9EURO|nr:hypothetical protein H2200_012432 [Cladophialophora chaetospira]
MAPPKQAAGPPKGTKHKQRRTAKKKGGQLKRRMGNLTVEDSSSDDVDHGAPTAPTAAEDTGPDTTTPATTINTLRYPLYDEWETLEDAEAEEVIKQHKSITDDKTGWIPQLLPVKVHVASPQAGRFTREIESDIEFMNSIDAVKDLVASSMGWELKRANVDLSQCKFAGLMVYEPTTEFDTATIKGYTRGLLLSEAAFKKWWLSVWKSERKPGDMVKIAFVLWDADEAAARQEMLPDFWTNAMAQVLGNHLEKLETKLLDIDIEEGCRAYVEMQRQVRDLRTELVQVKQERAELQTREGKLVASKTRLTKMGNELAEAVESGNLEEATRLVAGWKEATGSKEGQDIDQTTSTSSSNDDEDDDDEGARVEGGDNDSEEVEEIDDPNDANYVG